MHCIKDRLRIAVHRWNLVVQSRSR